MSEVSVESVARMATILASKIVALEAEVETLRELLIDCETERDMCRAQEGTKLTDDPQPIPHPGGPLDLKGQP